MSGAGESAAEPRPTVLVVDDEAGIRSLLSEYLREQGFEALQAANGLEALVHVRARRPSAVILDLAMPRLGGLEALKQIHVFDPTITVVVLSGYVDAETRRAALAHGAAAVFDKPVQFDELLDALGGPRVAAAPPAAPVAAAPGAPATRPPGTPARGRLLIVDDDEPVRSAFQDYLVGNGYEVGVAQDAELALRIMGQARVDVVLLDINLPRLSGVDALPVIRAAAPGVKVIMVSGTEDADVIRRVLARGAFDYVVKPVDWAYLIHAIDTAVAMKRLEFPDPAR